MPTDGITVSGQGAMAQSARIDLIAQNLANVLTPGYRRERMGFRQHLAEALGRRGAPVAERARFDEGPGPLEHTRRPLDFALRSRGFFAVRDLGTGALYYTRAGNFTLDAQGRLVTADGLCQALGEDGEGIALDPERPGEVRLAADGTLSQGESEAGRLSVADFPDAGALRKRGNNLYENAGTSAPSVPAGLRLDQGYLEGSSVDPASEMAEMIRALRALESNLQMIRFQDAVLDRTVNEYGRLPR